MNVIIEFGRIGIKFIIYLLLGCSIGGVEDEVFEGEVVVLFCFRDEDRFWRGLSGNYGVYESLVIVILLIERKNFLRILRFLEVLLVYVYCKRNFINLIYVC